MARPSKAPRTVVQVIEAMNQAMVAWNDLTDAQRKFLMASHKGATPAEIMRALGHNIPAKFDFPDEAQAQLALTVVKVA